jgi:hypothetical protein
MYEVLAAHSAFIINNLDFFTKVYYSPPPRKGEEKKRKEPQLAL